MNRFTRNLLLVLSVVLAVVFISRGGGMSGSGPERTEKSLSELWAMLEKPRPEVNSGYIQKDTFFFEDNKGNRYRTRIPDPGDRADLYATLKKSGVKFEIRPPLLSDSIQNLLLAFLPIIVIVALWMFFLRQAQQGGNQAMAFGRSRAKRVTENVPKVTFDDVAGVNEAKQELQEVVEFLKNPRKFQALGAKIPRGVLLLGPPGSGKTLLARAVAGEAGVPFFHISGSDFVEMFVGVGASRVRDLFDTAKANRPSLVFIDEIDAVGRHRGAGLGGGNDEREQTLNQLLVEMDGFESNEGVILIAATNRPDVLDPALLRPGRFDRQVVVPNPDVNGREKILSVHMKKVPLAPDVNPKTIARGTPGFSGADLANLVNEAALLAARNGKRVVGHAEFEAAKDKVLMGVERKSLVMSEEEKRMTAYHEAGHALVALSMPECDPVHKATIIPRGRALGLVMSLPEGDRYSKHKSKLLQELAMAMGGRAAEEVVFGPDRVSNGAAGDIKMATEQARRMVTEWGMSEKLGMVAYGENTQEVFLGHSVTQSKNISEATAQAIDAEIKRIIDEAYMTAKRIVTERRADLDAIAKALLEFETLTGDEIRGLLAGQPIVRKPAEETPAPDLRRASVPSAGRIPKSGGAAGGFGPAPQPNA